MIGCQIGKRKPWAKLIRWCHWKVLWTSSCYVSSHVLVQLRCIIVQFSQTDCVISDSPVYAISRSHVPIRWPLGSGIIQSTMNSLAEENLCTRLHMIQVLYIIEVKSLWKKKQHSSMIGCQIGKRKPWAKLIRWCHWKVLWTSSCYVSSHVLVQLRCIIVQFSQTDCVISDSPVYAISRSHVPIRWPLGSGIIQSTMNSLAEENLCTRLHMIQVLFKKRSFIYQWFRSRVVSKCTVFVK